MKEDILSGFSAVYGEISKGGNEDEKGFVDFDNEDEVDVDEEVILDDETDDDDGADLLGSDNSDSDDDSDVDDNPEDESSDVDDTQDDEPGDALSALFGAVLEAEGVELSDEIEAPKTVDELVEKVRDIVKSKIEPSYANEEIAQLDEYVRAGGNPKDFFALGGSIDYDNIDITNEYVQRAVVSELLEKKGYTTEQIQRKLEKYEDADILEDEALDAVELLKEISAQEKKELLESQKMYQQQAIEEQQKFYNSVTSQIDSLESIRGIAIPKEDKKILREYILKVEQDGKTKYQKEYAKSAVKNLIESAYFTMKGDSLLTSASKNGETKAVDKLKTALKSNSIGGSKRTITSGPAQPLWTMASKHLLQK